MVAENVDIPAQLTGPRGDRCAELEELLARSTSQLASVTAELDAFSYSVSHDLRAAILGIAACTQIVISDYGAGLSEDAKRWLTHIHEDSVQLDKLTEAMIDLSRVSRKALEPEDLDLSSMAQEIADGLASANADRTVEFSVRNGLSARGDANLVRTLLRNLLGNAWKFTGKIDGARIEFGLLEPNSLDNNNNNKIFYVRDNGAGFDMAHSDRLFVAFQRLHRDQDFPGNGIGLATVRRIVHQHGGRAWAEGEPGLGATFFFTLALSPLTCHASAGPLA
jgi:light-regulated signal transduction histidine kinase (bacteriophytochrome)